MDWTEEREAPCDYSGVTRTSHSAPSLPHSYLPSLSRFPQVSNIGGKSVHEIEPEILQLERAVPSLSHHSLCESSSGLAFQQQDSLDHSL